MRALERMLVATLGVVEMESPTIFEKMQPRAKVAMTVRGDAPLRRVTVFESIRAFSDTKPNDGQNSDVS